MSDLSNPKNSHGAKIKKHQVDSWEIYGSEGCNNDYVSCQLRGHHTKLITEVMDTDEIAKWKV